MTNAMLSLKMKVICPLMLYKPTLILSNGSTTLEHLIEKFHQEFMFKVEFDFEEGGDFFEDIMLDEQDYEDSYLYTNIYPRRRRIQSSPQTLEDMHKFRTSCNICDIVILTPL